MDRQQQQESVKSDSIAVRMIHSLADCSPDPFPGAWFARCTTLPPAYMGYISISLTRTELRDSSGTQGTSGCPRTCSALSQGDQVAQGLSTEYWAPPRGMIPQPLQATSSNTWPLLKESASDALPQRQLDALYPSQHTIFPVICCTHFSYMSVFC